MNTQTNRSTIFIIGLIMAMLATATLFLIPMITLTYLIAYAFTLLAIVMFCMGNLYLLSNKKSFPWFVAFPATIWRYLIAQLVLSVVFILREFLTGSHFPIGVFVFLHLVVLSFFVVFLLLMHGGKEVIEKRDAEVKQKVSTLRLLQADVEAIARQFPQHEEPLQQVVEAIKYSDPMSHPSVGIYEEDIQRSVMSMSRLEGNDTANIPQICETLLKQIADRNSRVKLMK